MTGNMAQTQDFSALRDLIADTVADLSNGNPYWTVGCLADALIKTGRIRLASPAQEEAVAVRYDFDGQGWQYADSGSGSDWRTRHKDGDPLYAHPPAQDVAALAKFGDRK